MRVVHFSDYHAKTRKLPKADLYICTGDMLPNTEPPPWGIRWPNAYQEEPFQKEWVEKNAEQYSALPASKAPLIIVRGNHDFIDLAPLFRFWPGRVYEFMDEPSWIAVDGFCIGGFRGIPPINDCWADENTERVLAAKCEALGKVDVLVTHCPAYERRDRCDDGRRIGSTAVREYVDTHRPRAHFFGHIHESAGKATVNGTLFSNAATTINTVKI